MEPQLPTPYTAPEAAPDHGAPERRGASVESPQEDEKLSRPETHPSLGQERQGAEQSSRPSGGGDPNWQAKQTAQAASTATAPTPVAQMSTPVSDTPLTANDDDLIEQEWVQKAKKIVAGTKTDPYKQEVEVSKLQADYLQKRYGKAIKLSSD